MEVRTVRPVNEQLLCLFAEHTDRFFVDDDDMDSDTIAESDMSLKSRSFLHRVNDRVRKMLNQFSKVATQDNNKHSLVWRMFMSSTLETSVFVVKNNSDNLHSIETLISEQLDEIYGVNTINWEDSSWKYLSLVGDEEVISLSHAKAYVFSDSVLCLGKMHQNPQSNIAWEDRLACFKSSPQLATKSKRYCVKIERNTRKIHRTDHLHVDVQRHLMGIPLSLCKEIWSRTLVIPRTWIREKSGTLSVKTVHKENGTEL